MIKTGTFVAGALIAIVTLSTSSFAQSLSQFDIEQQRLNDIRQRTTDSGMNPINHPLDRPSLADGYDANVRDRELLGIAQQHFNDTAR
ncbi:MAG: hypothetical protein JWO28_2899 [Hyphomicrobiales bacterium]|nr:hypothetical protein [Hyphomicrobiales bacterium]